MKLVLNTLCENTAGTIGISGEWGLSIMVEAGGNAVLLDTGYNGKLVENAGICGVDLRKVDKVILSHGHADHTGGLRSFLQYINKEIEIIAHPDVWGKKYTRRNKDQKDKYSYIGIPFCSEELTGLGVEFKYTREPLWLNDFIVVTGEIPMVTPFESIDENLFLRDESGFVADPLKDDQALIIKSNSGLVIVSGCAHRGIINIILHARKITGVEKVYAVVGGTHLFRASQERVAKTITALRDFGVEKLGVSHCTGLPVAAELARSLEGAFFFNNAGTRIEFDI